MLSSEPLRPTTPAPIWPSLVESELPVSVSELAGTSPTTVPDFAGDLP
jgi:hypothetical protein